MTTKDFLSTGKFFVDSPLLLKIAGWFTGLFHLFVSIGGGKVRAKEASVSFNKGKLEDKGVHALSSVLYQHGWRT